MGDSDKLTRYQKQQKGKQGQSSVRLQGQLEKKVGGTRERADRTQQRQDGDKIDSIFGFERMKEGLPRVGWLLNYLPITMADETGIEKSGMDLYFIERGSNTNNSGEGNFKATVFFEPYLYLDVSDPRRMMEISNTLIKRFEGCKVQVVEREDLDLPNHLSGKKHPFLKLSFGTTSELMDAKSQLRPIIMQNQKRIASAEDYLFSGNSDDALVNYLGSGASGAEGWEEGTSAVTSAAAVGSRGDSSRDAAQAAVIATDPLSYLIDFREHDVPYAVRASIDLDLRVGAWYTVTPEYGSERCTVAIERSILELCEPRILAFDIECEKSPLKFPNAETDRIFMISYMVKNQGYLIINRDVVSEDIEDFEYTPKPAFPGPFKVFNEKDEEAVLRKFVSHVQELKPHVIVTYNGDKFDWPYVETRCKKYAYLSLYKDLGIKSTSQAATNSANAAKDGKEAVPALFSDNEYTGRCMIHLDAFCWVQRDSYLPQGNQGLKSVTKYKLGYDPVEVDPEDMLRFARERPHHMASYSVSDAVATYYLYTTYVHNFIFSLSTIIPMAGEDVLRKGSGTLCEMLLMVEAYNGNIVCPNKQVDALETFHEGHLLESETYIGGHVECLEAGVFRADIPAKFTLVPSALQQLINNIDRDLTFTLEVEHGMQRSDAVNYDEVRQAIVQKLEMLRDSPLREEAPIIYHLDVGAMYPNIILTNRLQPSAMVSTSDCAACVYNKAESNCKRPMTWTWRGDFSPTGYSEYQSVRRQLAYERVAVNPSGGFGGNAGPNAGLKTFSELGEKEQAALIRTRLKAYAQRVYRKTKVTSIQERVDTVCMRENSFYVDTVKAFRDRRYDYKLFTKEWKNKKVAAEKAGDKVQHKAAEDMETLMDSLQLAHKCILNSFYGYVMRKGARWRSMEMAGIVTHTGAQLIKQARELVEQVGRPLELDTDGIWCILPTSFPQDFKIKMKGGGSVSVGYPCAMLNADVHERYTNHQYQELQKTDANGGTSTGIRYATHSECSIFFELDGPYKAMVLPASPEEGKLLKKKYVVFNFNGTIAELKGFELKRRGELELVKIFQSQVFEHFLAGDSLDECYRAVGAIANQWLDVLDEQGASMDDSELLELISERKTISKTVDDYEGRKSTSLTTAARLADFLGADMVRDKGLNCNLIISRLPAGAPVTERAIPVAIFSCEPTIRKYFLRKWLKDSTLDCDDFRHLVDWSYYKERIGKSIQKIITIPAGLQRVLNPCPRVEHPIWLQRSINERASGRKQLSILSSFSNMRVASEARAAAAADAAAAAATAAPKLLSNGTGTLSSMPKSILSIATETEGAASKPRKRVRIQLEGEPSVEDLEGDSPRSNAITAGGEVGDLEDFGGAVGTGVAKTGVVRVSNFKPASASTSEESTVTEVAEKVSIIALNELPDGHHSSKQEFDTWLQDRKNRWAAQRQARRQQRKELQKYGTSGGMVPGAKKNVGVADFVRNASLAATMGFWQVIEIQETDSPGEFVVWAMTAPTQLQRLNVVIPRQLFVNVLKGGKEAQAAAINLGGVRVNKDLPHGKQCRELFEVHIPERKFLRNERALNLFLCDAQVEGVYESQVPLWLRGVLTMGCVATVNQRAQQSTNKFFKLQDLDLVHVQSHPYLTHHTANYRRIYVYFAADKTRVSGDLGIIAVFQLEATNLEHMEEQQHLLSEHLSKTDSDSENASQAEHMFQNLPFSGKAYVWLINGRAGSLDSRPPLQRIYRKFQPNERAQIKFIQSFAPTLAAAWQLCNERLTTYQRERHGPTVAIVQGGQGSDNSNAAHGAANTKANVQNVTTGAGMSVGMDSRQWRHVLPALHDFPLAVMPAHSLDHLFPAVGWQMFTAERMVQRFLIFPRWFDDRLTSARYAHIPLCNLGPDALTTMIDVTFSRSLIHNRHLLWASEGTNAPDLGKGADSGQELLDIWSEALKEPVINVPGVYRGACIELDLYGLAVCAIMSSGELDAEGLTTLAMAASGAANSAGEMYGAGKAAGSAGAGADSDDEDEGAGGSGKGEDAQHLVMVVTDGVENTSDASCARAFNIFKAMVTKCMEEAHSAGTSAAESGVAGIADSILTAVYRYLCGYGNGLLSDPLLHRVIYGLMTKLFQKLVGALRKLGTRVVYADFGRIIISTDKHDYASAQEYVDFILAALSNKPTFAYLQVSVKRYWEQMCWLGPENWGGLPLKLPVPEPEITELDGDDSSAQTPVEADEDTEEDEPVFEDSEEQNSSASSHTTKSFTKADKHVKSPSKVSPSPSKKGLTAASPAPKSAAKEPAQGEFDFLDEINSTSSKGLSGTNLSSIKQFFGHKASATPTTAASPTTNKSAVATAKKFTSNKHHARDPSPRKSAGSDGDSDDGYQSDDYGFLDDVDADHDGDGEEGAEEQVVELETAPALLDNWNLATYLPSAAAEFFQFIVGEFMTQYKTKREQLLLIKQHALQRQDSGVFPSGSSVGNSASADSCVGSNLDQLQGSVSGNHSTAGSSVFMDVLMDEHAIDEAVANFMRELIKERLTTKMLEIVDELQLQFNHETRHGSAFPIRAGSHLPLTSPALEFVKASTHVMGLDPQLALEVASLRRLLLTQLRVREFSADSVFQDPCLSYTLRDVICSYCSTCRDLDLLRDAALTCEDPAQRWKCKQCGNRINTEEVENRLLEAVDKLNAAYLLQDFRCRNTHRVSRRLGSSMSDLCDPLMMDTSRNEVLGKLRVLRQVATFHNFGLLQSSVDELMV